MTTFWLTFVVEFGGFSMRFIIFSDENVLQSINLLFNVYVLFGRCGFLRPFLPDLESPGRKYHVFSPPNESFLFFPDRQNDLKKYLEALRFCMGVMRGPNGNNLLPFRPVSSQSFSFLDRQHGHQKYVRALIFCMDHMRGPFSVLIRKTQLCQIALGQELSFQY